MEKISRREFLQSTSVLGLAALLSQNGISPLFAEDDPQMGDVLTVGRESFLLRSNKAYLIPDLEKYIKNKKLNRYGRKIYPVSRGFLNQYEVVSDFDSRPLIPDPVTGELKNAKPFGGEMIDFYSGIFTSEGMPHDQVIPEVDTFRYIIDDLEERKNFQVGDYLFYNHGAGKFDKFTPKDTLQPPEENIEFALSRAEKIKNDFPLVQLNMIGHSFGCIMALEVARKHPDLINSLTLINGPVRGIEWNLIREGLRKVVRPLIWPFVGEEYVTDYLVKKWEDKVYQRELDEFVRDFLRMGRSITVVIAENDPIVPKESALLPGALTVTLMVGDPRLNFMEYPKEHGLPLKHSKVVPLIGDIVGDNLV